MDWDDIRKKGVGTILHDEFDEGLRFIIMRGPASLCAYVGIPLDHPLAGHGYDDLPIDAHGGLTYASEGGGEWPVGFFWYGWDYAHGRDYCFHDDEFKIKGKVNLDKKWNIEEVKQDAYFALCDFKRLMKLSESIAKKFGSKPLKVKE